MPSKKKKFNSRFPPARIKKIMQKDEEVGKVAAVVPVIISRALELFVDNLLKKTYEVTKSKQARTLSSSHLKSCIQSNQQYAFLSNLASSIPDLVVDEEGLTAPNPRARLRKAPKAQGTSSAHRVNSSDGDDGLAATSDDDSSDEGQMVINESDIPDSEGEPSPMGLAPPQPVPAPEDDDYDS